MDLRFAAVPEGKMAVTAVNRHPGGWSTRLASQRELNAVFLAPVSAGRDGQMATVNKPSTGKDLCVGALTKVEEVRLI
jgi:hypothetical protein